MRPIFVIVLAPVFDRLPRVSEGEKPILIQALLAQSTIEALDESIVCWLTWPAELELHAVTVRPIIEHLGNEFAAIVDLDRLWQAVLGVKNACIARPSA